MAKREYTKVLLCVDRDGWTGGTQISIDIEDDKGQGTGYRISGPKFNGSSKRLATAILGERDVAQIRQYLDMVFPPHSIREGVDRG